MFSLCTSLFQTLILINKAMAQLENAETKTPSPNGKGVQKQTRFA